MAHAFMQRGVNQGSSKITGTAVIVAHSLCLLSRDDSIET